MHKLCTNCYYFGYAKRNVSGVDLGWSLFMALIGIVSLTIDGDILGSRIIFWLVAVILILYGIYETYGYFNANNACPKCHKNTMLPLDNPRALELIKRYDLTLGENPKPQSSPGKQSQPFRNPKTLTLW